MKRLIPFALAVACAALLPACEQKDTTAPPPPNLDPVETLTNAVQVDLTGSAEYGSTVTVTGGSAEVSVVADPYTARFRATVQLPLGAATTFSLTATDAAGNVSQPATVTITQGRGVVIQNVTVNGAPCDPSLFSPPQCPVLDGDEIALDVAVLDDQPIQEVAYSAFFASSQTLRTRTVFVPNDVTSTTAHFIFTVSSGAPEVVDIVATDVDRLGHRQNSAPYPLNVRFGVIGVGGHVVGPPITDSLLNGPTDVTVTSAGDWIVLSAGNGRVLRRPAGGGALSTLAQFTDMQFITRGTSRAGPERLYVSRPADGRVFRLELNGTGLTAFADPNGQNSRGLAMLAPIPARGWADVTAAVDGDSITVAVPAGATETWELDSNGSCTTAGNLHCVTIPSGATAAQKRDALVTALGSSTVVNATAGSATNGRANLSARAAGEAGSSITLTKTPGGSAILLSAATLVEGHDQELYVTNDGDAVIRRYNLDGGPFSSGTDHGNYPAGDISYGVAIRDAATAAGPELMRLVAYMAGDPNNFGTLRGRVLTVTSSGTSLTPGSQTLFALTRTTTGRLVDFNRLWDTELTPQGCLLASDEGAGVIYAVDVRDPTNASPSAEVIALGFNSPRGLALDAGGNLIVADTGAGALYTIAPTASATDCF